MSIVVGYLLARAGCSEWDVGEIDHFNLKMGERKKGGASKKLKTYSLDYLT
jgi:hypothetical protein